MLGLGIIVELFTLGVARGLWTIVAAHVLVILPTATFIILVRLEGLDPSFELAAMDLGAKPFQVLRRIILPQISGKSCALGVKCRAAGRSGR